MYSNTDRPFYFRFKKQKSIFISNDEVFVLFAPKINLIIGSLIMQNKEYPVFENYKGDVLIKKKYFGDRGFLMDNPQMGVFISSNSDLCLDIDRSNRVWLTGMTFEETFLRNQLARLKRNPKGNSLIIIELQERVFEIELNKANYEAYKEAQRNSDIEYDNSVTGQIEDFANEEIRRMNIESEGLWDI